MTAAVGKKKKRSERRRREDSLQKNEKEEQARTNAQHKIQYHTATSDYSPSISGVRPNEFS